MSAATAHVPNRAVLVCGLGRVGRQCLQSLRGYGVPVRAIDLLPQDPVALELGRGAVTRGDFRDLATLLRAGIGECHSIVLASSDPAANVKGGARGVARELGDPVRDSGAEARLARAPREAARQPGVYEPNRSSAATLALATLDSDHSAVRVAHRLLCRARFDLRSRRSSPPATT